MRARVLLAAVLRPLVVLLLLAASVTRTWAGETLPTGCASTHDLPWQAVVPGVWVWLPESAGDASPYPTGHVSPTTVIVDGDEALVIDPGPNQAHAWRVRQSLACRFKARVRWVVNSHAHAENVLGNSAFVDLMATGSLEILSSAATREAMRLRCFACLERLTERVGAATMAGTHPVLPGRILEEGDVLRVGRHALRVMPVEHGHTEGDLVLWDASQRVLWAGGLVYGERVPELAQGQLDDWLAALPRLAALRPAVLVSSALWFAGQDGTLSAIEATRAYLQALRAAVLQAMDTGAQPQDAFAVDLPRYRHWLAYDPQHTLNVQRVWRQLEPVCMNQVPAHEPATVQDVGR